MLGVFDPDFSPPDPNSVGERRRARARKIRNYGVICTVGSVGLGICSLLTKRVVSVGTQIGCFNTVSAKTGLMWRTPQADFLRTTRMADSHRGIIRFTFRNNADVEVARKFQLAQTSVNVNYTQYCTVFPWKGDSTVFVDSIKALAKS